MTKRNKGLFGTLATAWLACTMAAAPGWCGAAAKGEPLPDLGSAPAAETPSDGPSAADLEQIAKMTSNPLGAAWMLWLQNDTAEQRGDLVPGGKILNSTKFQPVMSFPIDVGKDEWNLIVRPVIQCQSVPLDSQVGQIFGTSPEAIVADPELGRIAATAWDSRTSGLGDTALLTLVAPNRLDGFSWGIGASQIFPTAEQDVLGQGKWQAGPAVLLAKLAPKPGGFNVGALAQHWWSYAGD
ncbi:MAG TPA: hypothetical protein VES73_04735, partial [Lamprocystis sp. (in: g-proteobacteria)]|nr:hypothetical protein [Lamprocystis sp. (in: g-proteobacteria)]